MIRDDLQRVGIHMRIKSAEWSVYGDQIDSRDFDACSFYWNGGIESDPYQLWHGSQAGREGSSNIPGFANDEADALMEEARRTLDFEKRTALYQRFHRIVHDEQPYTFLYCPNAKLAQPKRYQNVIVYPLGVSPDLMWVPSGRQRSAGP